MDGYIQALRNWLDGWIEPRAVPTSFVTAV